MKKQIFLEKLPTKEGIGINKGKQVINWKECIGYKVEFIYDDIKGNVEIIDHNPKSQKIKIKYNNKEINISTGHFLNCKLGNILCEVTSDFKIKIGTIFKDDKRDIIITDRKVLQKEKIDKLGRKSILNEKWYKYYCNRCTFNCGRHYNIKDKYYKDECWVIESSLIKGSGCACCTITPKIVVEHINSIYKTDKWMIPIINDDEFCKTHTHSCTAKIYPTCLDCGEVYKINMTINSIYQNYGFTCICQDGIKYPNKFMTSILKELNLDFETEYSPEWIGDRRYDSYIPSMNLIIEMDGEFHNKDNHYNGQTKEESKSIDDYKDEQAKLHDIAVIRIDCDYPCLEQRFEFIKQNVINKLKNNFSLNKLDWVKCNEFATSNLIKLACKYKRNNHDITARDIGRLMGYSTFSIISWLKTGNELGWCIYNSQNEIDKNNKLNGERLRKKRSRLLICIDTERIFESASSCSINSVDVFGIQLTHTAITAVCSGSRVHHKGYHFKYISDLTQEEYIKYDIENKLRKIKEKDLKVAN